MRLFAFTDACVLFAHPLGPPRTPPGLRLPTPTPPTLCHISYNAVNGVPTCLDSNAQNGVLRGELGHIGLIVSDCGALQDAWQPRTNVTVPPHFGGHGYAANATEAAALACRAGTDQNCGGVFLAGLPAAVQSGLLAERDLDRALQRTFSMRVRLGMFDESVPYRDPVRYGAAALDTAASRALALQAAEEAIVLLKNENGLLPLLGAPLSSRSLVAAALRVAVIGPTADNANVQLGGKQDYCPSFTVTHAGRDGCCCGCGTAGRRRACRRWVPRLLRVPAR